MLVCNFQITLEDSRAITDSAKIRYLCTLLCGEALRQLYVISIEVISTTTTHLNRTILGLGVYFFLLMCCQSKSAQYAAE